MRQPAGDTWLWLIAIALTIISAGAYVGNEAAQYFWDLKIYVESLDSPFPYRYDTPYPFLYPPVAKQLFELARTHLFELLSIGYVAAAALFLWSVAQLQAPRSIAWLAAMTSAGGLGVVSLMSGNVAILLNLTLLAVMLQSALGNAMARTALPVVIAAGALIKPQFVIYAGLLWFIEPSRLRAIVKIAAVVAVVAAVHALYAQLRPFDWSEYTQAVVKRTLVEKDYGWGPGAYITHFTSSNAIVFGFAAAWLAVVALLARAAWRRSAADAPPVALLSLVFVVLTFANPRTPAYDVYAALTALAVCCAWAAQPRLMLQLLVILLAVNIVPWTISEFARTPTAWPWWATNTHLGHLACFPVLLAGLARHGMTARIGV